MSRRKGRPSWTPEQEAELTRLWRTDASLREIGRHFGISHVAVLRQTEKMGLQKPKKSWAEDDPILIRLFHEGLDNREIAKQLGRTAAAVQVRKCELRKLGCLPPAFVQKAPASRSKPPVVVERKVRKCLRCRETFASEHRGNWICRECLPLVNRAQAAIA